jgi:hypothetical protein
VCLPRLAVHAVDRIILHWLSREPSLEDFKNPQITIAAAMPVLP